ncbi:hypothetical protein GW17_00030406 [Ensete ventricosum]|nr:hypothetical protein GW17_00030406 [Ensete ventricosum]RZS02057.1 hypothetical protein BHM03_00032019 [Ensete ventricosum]
MVKATIQQPQQSRAMDAFEKLEKVGEGTYGKVYKARERATGKIVALKKTRLPEDDEGVPPTTLREVSLLRMLSVDPHIVRWCSLNHHDYRTTLVISSFPDKGFPTFLRFMIKNRHPFSACSFFFLLNSYSRVRRKLLYTPPRTDAIKIPPSPLSIMDVWLILLDLKQGQNKEGQTILYLVFEYMDTDLKKYIRSLRQVHEVIPPKTVKSDNSVEILRRSLWFLQILMYQLCKGLAFCHGRGVLHR